MAQYKNIDIVPDESITRIHLSQGDIGRTLIFYLFENALSWSVPASSTIKCQGTKPSGFGFSVSCTYSGNAVTCVTTDEMTDEYGQIEAELVITSSDESLVFGTSNFILDIEKNPHPDGIVDGDAENPVIANLDAVITQATYDWLDEHPEVTTTVQDGSITEPKLASALATKINNKADASALADEATTRASADTALSNQIAALQGTVGSPLLASTVAGMTDTTKIYVYTGSETGYTSGDWYYYNGSAWVGGGVYNAVAVDADETLSVSGMPADAKAVGDAIAGTNAGLKQVQINVVDLESGTFQHPNGYVKTSNASRIRSVSPIPIVRVKSIDIPSGYEAYFYRLNNDFSTLSNSGTWCQGNVVKSLLTDSNRASYMTIVFRNVSTPSADITSQIATVRSGFAINTELDANLTDLDNAIRQNQTQRIAIESGTFQDANGAFKIANNKRLRNVSPLAVYGIKSVTIPSGFEAYVFRLSFNRTHLGNAGWKSGTVDMSTIVNADTYYLNFAIKKTDSPNSDISAYASTLNLSLSYTADADFAAGLANLENAKIDKDYNDIVKSVCRIADDLSVPHQSIIGYKTAYKLGFRAMLCDLRFTSDDVPVLAHDAYLNQNYSDVYLGDTLVEPNTVAIASTTYADLLQYDFGRYKGTAYANTPIMTLEQMLNLCKCLGCDVWLETKTTLTSAQYGIVFGLIRAYGMERRVVWNSQSVQQLSALVAYEPNVYICLHTNLSSGGALNDTAVNAIINATNDYNRGHMSLTLALGATMTTAQANTLSDSGVSVVGTTLNTEAEVLQYYNQGKPYTCIEYVLSNTILAGKALFNNVMDI